VLIVRIQKGGLLNTEELRNFVIVIPRCCMFLAFEPSFLLVLVNRVVGRKRGGWMDVRACGDAR